MYGERNLDALRSRMSPTLNSETFVYCSFDDGAVPAGLAPICTFREREAMTAIVPKAQAQVHGIAYQFECAMITLNVHSSLEAIGFLAVVTQALARERIPCNVVSAYFHDHLFIPVADRERALKVLAETSAAT